jgi:hypothetical protein
VNKGERNHLKRILQFALTVFPKPAIFVEPSKRALDNPSLWQNSKGMKFISSDDFNFSPGELFDFVGKVLSRVTSVRKEFLSRDK